MPAQGRDNGADQPNYGAYIDLETLIGARFSARDINLQQRRTALSLLAGANKTNFRGRGIDFEEVRAYQPGDDIRTIDWRVTARSTQAYTKVFREERERPLLMVTDQRQGMFFGSRTCFKSVSACYLSALLAWSGLEHGDRVGGLVFGNEGHREVRPRRSRRAVLGLLNELHDFNHRLQRDTGLTLSNEQSMSQALTELWRVARPGCAIFLISDFAGFRDDEHRKLLHQLARHCEITALFVYDPLERELPPPGQYMISDGRRKALINTAGAPQRKRYTQHFENRRRELQQSFAQLGIPMIEADTTQAPLRQLRHYYGARRRARRATSRGARR